MHARLELGFLRFLSVVISLFDHDEKLRDDEMERRVEDERDDGLMLLRNGYRRPLYLSLDSVEHGGNHRVVIESPISLSSVRSSTGKVWLSGHSFRSWRMGRVMAVVALPIHLQLARKMVEVASVSGDVVLFGKSFLF